MKIRGLGNRQMYLLPQSIAAFSMSRRLNFTTLGLDLGKKLPLAHFFFFHAPSSRFYSSTRVPVFGQSNEPIPTQLSEISEKSTSSWPVSSRCRPETGRRNNSMNFEFRNCNERFRTTSSRGRFFCDRSIVNLTKLISIKKRE